MKSKKIDGKIIQMVLKNSELKRAKFLIAHHAFLPHLPQQFLPKKTLQFYEL